MRTLFNVVGGGCDAVSIGFFVVSLRHRMKERAKSHAEEEKSGECMIGRDARKRAGRSILPGAVRSNWFNWTKHFSS
jgi:hypothetical protein